uniref:B30.2/SPRY domain-containing protein n=1 Tax=Oreochromis aureus TaxID=47969 RepID=A0AAZ1XZR5_OREAU
DLSESGQNVTLTCRAANNNTIVVEWSRADLDEYVLLYRDEGSVLEEQHPSFKNRVDLQDRQMKDGDVSLILKDVMINDTGTYECRVIQGGPSHQKTVIKNKPICIIYFHVKKGFSLPHSSELHFPDLFNRVIAHVLLLCLSLNNCISQYLKEKLLPSDHLQVSLNRPNQMLNGEVKPFILAVAQLEETLWKPMKKKLFKAELKRVQQYEVDVTLDPDTANPALILCDDRKQVYHSDVKKKLPDNSERFSQCVCVLGEQSFSSGRFYFEVEVKGKTEWDLGVARKSIDRKANIILSPQNGFWTVLLRNGNEYKAFGVFVDYEEGLVSFYDVNAAALIYSFTGCSFTHKLHPYFGPSLNHGGNNSAPLIICPVNQPIND